MSIAVGQGSSTYPLCKHDQFNNRIATRYDEITNNFHGYLIIIV